ncbi:hypothetical protein CNY89_29300, partial [Amaricoccus sp. HAR-UPW-R2A-40]
ADFAAKGAESADRSSVADHLQRCSVERRRRGLHAALAANSVSLSTEADFAAKGAESADRSSVADHLQRCSVERRRRGL